MRFPHQQRPSLPNTARYCNHYYYTLHLCLQTDTEVVVLSYVLSQLYSILCHYSSPSANVHYSGCLEVPISIPLVNTAVKSVICDEILAMVSIFFSKTNMHSTCAMSIEMVQKTNLVSLTYE